MDILSQLPEPTALAQGFPWTISTPAKSYDSLHSLPKISIVTPSFNQGQFIEETIRSVLLQNYPNFEYIIIDGGSTDDTVSIIKKYEKWIHCWVSESDEGQSDAINKGLAIATGTVFNWLNSDDVLAPNALWTIAECFKNAHTQVLIGKLQVIQDDKLLPEKYGMVCSDDVESTICFGRMSQPSLFFRLEIVKLLRGVDKTLHYCMDLDLWYRYLLTFGLNGIVATKITLAYYRIHDATKTSNAQQANAEWLSLQFSLLKAMDVTEKRLSEIKPNGIKVNNLDKTWILSKLDILKLKAYLLESILRKPSFEYPISVSLGFWFESWRMKWLGRRIYFFSLPLRFVYRKWKQDKSRS